MLNLCQSERLKTKSDVLKLLSFIHQTIQHTKCSVDLTERHLFKSSTILCRFHSVITKLTGVLTAKTQISIQISNRQKSAQDRQKERTQEI